jgi:hypothetical protein
MQFKFIQRGMQRAADNVIRGWRVKDLRVEIAKSALLNPDAVDEREPLWIEFFEARYGTCC